VSEGTGPDLADPEASETAYDGSPLAAARSLYLALDHLQADLSRIACPVLIMTSAEDHVVPPDNSDHLAAQVSGPVERITLPRSYHVATLDHDREEVAARTVRFVNRVTAGPSL
jgi:carboxylesterase